MAFLGKTAMGSTEANQKPEAVFVTDSVGYAHLLGDDHGSVLYRRSWRLLINAAIVVFLFSCVFANSSLAEERADVAYRFYRLGQEFYAKGQYQKAIGYYEKALAINRESLGEKHPEVEGQTYLEPSPRQRMLRKGI